MLFRLARSSDCAHVRGLISVHLVVMSTHLRMLRIITAWQRKYIRTRGS
jgi:hypothetical protein